MRVHARFFAEEVKWIYCRVQRQADGQPLPEGEKSVIKTYNRNFFSWALFEVGYYRLVNGQQTLSFLARRQNG